MPARAKTSFVIDIRDPRLPAGRLKVTARTTSKVEARRREAALRRLIDLGEFGVLRRLQSRQLRVEEIVRAVEGNTFADLRPAAETGRYALQAQVDRMLERVPRASYAGYASCFRGLVADLGEGFDMAALTRDQALAWLHAPKKSSGNKPWAPATRELNRIRCAALWDMVLFAAQEEADRLDRRSSFRRNPWKHAKGSRGTKEGIRPRQAYLQPAEWERLISRVRGTRRAVFYGLCCLAGLRRREALMLRMVVDLELPPEGGGRVRIQPREGDREWSPKTARGVRDVAITPELRRLIDEHIANGHAGERYLLRSTTGDHPTDTTTAEDWARSDFTAVGLQYGRAGDGVTIHSLRHTYASWLVQMDAPTLKVALLLGDTVEMVERVYGHLAPTDLVATAHLIDAKLAAYRTNEKGEESTRSDTVK